MRDDQHIGNITIKTASFIYEGEFKGGTMNGKGKLMYNDGRGYEGTFKDAALKGKGKEYREDGSVIEATFIKGVAEGMGTLTEPDGTIYMDNFTETANAERCSVCSVGIVIVKDGDIVDKFYSLIQPEPDYYCYWNTRVHGLTQKDTMDAPVFPKIWEQVEPLIEGLPLVAHNARFDEGCLKAVFKVYQMDYPDYEFHDTLKAARKAFPCAPNHQLHTISALCGYDLTMRHHALADAEACARIAIEIL